MSGKDNQFQTFIANISGGTGGVGGFGGRTGGAAGAGEGPIVNFGGVQNLTNNISVSQGQGLKEEMRKWLCIPSDMTDRHHELQSLRHKDTGCWLLHDYRFIRWKTTSSALWIKGISGTGKSVLRFFVLLICT
ncbi:Sensor protein gacS [Mycena venus]|uniref:Sensor protein gacS n=1 Tax=Mycena venus TaxID=2733690 RepID=A0A8H6U3A1_9AGAR|nr:Sensor protein gacS [Mycena venus]